ncbi:MAG: anti-sigma factor [Flavobacteriales bacterium]|nr:anti-sigma factor [Flavobacteriales bacterium]
MNAQEYIASGKLELFVYGTLSEEENLEIIKAIQEMPEVRLEVEKIEASLKTLSEGVSPGVSERIWNIILTKIGKNAETKVVSMEKRTNWAAISGWAAAIVFLGGIFWMMKQNNDLNSTIVENNLEKTRLEEQIVSTESNLEEANELLTILRDKDIKSVNLPGNQAVSPNAYAKVFYNETTRTVHLDARGLPEPPEGMVYQVWSLTLDPLTPTSIGLLDTFITDTNKVFVLDNVPESEAFGITLEPAGGSASPTMNQLYTLGII